MSIEVLRNRLPDYAKDIKLNLGAVLSEEGAPDLTMKQIWMIALASSYAAQFSDTWEMMLADAGNYLSEKELEAAKSAAVIMSMNNVYYRFVHLVSDKSFSTLPAKLRMSVIGNPGVDKIDFELCCLAVSALNGCGMCMDAHAKELMQGGVSKVGVQSAVRIAAVVHAMGVGIRVQ